MLNYFEHLRAREFRRLDERGETYLDYTGSALYPESAVRWHCDLLQRGVFGNPHSAHGPSRHSTEATERARLAVLAFLDADPQDYTVVFTANASAAVKLVAESYPFSADRGLVLTADNHNSVNGIREYARRADAPVTYVPLDRMLRLDGAERILAARSGTAGLVAFPAQSNFSGVRHPLSLVARAQAHGHEVLLDAAAFVPAARLSLREVPADFVTISLYKIAGYPTGVGALVARTTALARLGRPWFAGGTVEFASVRQNTFLRRQGPDRFEDGTSDFLALSAVPMSLGFVSTVDVARLSTHVRTLTTNLAERLQALKHRNGAPVVRLYGLDERGDLAQHGGTLAFNVFDRSARPVPYARVEQSAATARVAFRGGCFCNPGAAETAFGWPEDGDPRALGPQWAVGAVRASIGLANNIADIDRAVAVIAQYRE